MYLKSLRGTLRNCVILACVFSLPAVTSVAEVLSGDGRQLNQEKYDVVLGLLVAFLLILLGSLVLIRCRSRARQGWDQRREEIEFERLVEESVGAGKSSLRAQDQGGWK